MSPWAATSAAFISDSGRSGRTSAASSPGTCSRGSHAPHRLEEGALGYSQSKPNRVYFVPPPPSTGGPPRVSSLRPPVTPPPVTRGAPCSPAAQGVFLARGGAPLPALRLVRADIGSPCRPERGEDSTQLRHSISPSFHTSGDIVYSSYFCSKIASLTLV